MLSPSRVKFRKAHKGRVRNIAVRGNTLSFGSYGLQAIEPGRLTARQIEAARRAITRKVKRTGKLWIRVFPDIPVTEKPVEVRMGKGKGAHAYWMTRIKVDRILFEMGGVPYELAKKALQLGAAKLPIKTKQISKD